MTAEAIWTGTLRRGDQPGTVAGQLTDSWGYVVTLYGTHNKDGTYTLTGTLGIPPHLEVAGIDVPLATPTSKA